MPEESRSKNPDRVDLIVRPDQRVLVLKFRRLDGRDAPMGPAYVNDELEIAQAAQWLEAHGYTVRRWPTGLRAWRGEPWAIRTPGQIRKRRAEVEQLAQAGHLPGKFFYGGLNFALDM